MSKVVDRSKMLVGQIANGDLAGARRDVRQWLWSEQEYVGLRRDLSVPFTPAPAEVELTAVLVDDELAKKVFDDTGLGERDKTYLERRRQIYEAGFANGFVALAPGDEPAYLQWLIPPSQHAKVADYFGPLFPLEPDTLIVEGAWIPPAYRKSNVMGEGLSKVTVAAAAASPEATHALCFPERRNKGAVKGSQGGGYEISLLRTDRWRLGRRTVSFAGTTASELGF